MHQTFQVNRVLQGSSRAFFGLTVVGSLAAAQVPAIAKESDEGRLIIDILDRDEAQEPDTLAHERCADEADAARITGEIVVCRSLGKTTDGLWDQQGFQRRYAERSEGITAPELYSDPTPAMVGITFTAEFGGPPPPLRIIHIEALPEPPEGSDADRVAEGLPAIDIAPEAMPNLARWAAPTGHQ